MDDPATSYVQSSLEMHMVHVNTRYQAKDAGNHPDGYLVVGILFEEKKNAPFKVILTQIVLLIPISNFCFWGPTLV